jgi:hypothetical protein
MHTTRLALLTPEDGRQRAAEATTFPIDPNAPDGPDRSGYLALHSLARTRVRGHPVTLTLARAGPA